jgi:hypothetical protein
MPALNERDSKNSAESLGCVKLCVRSSLLSAACATGVAATGTSARKGKRSHM